MVKRLCSINIDFDRLIIDQAFENVFPSGLKKGACAAVTFAAFYSVEQLSADQHRIAAQACTYWYNGGRDTRPYLVRLDQAIDEGCRKATRSTKTRSLAALKTLASRKFRVKF
jgi:hypothetical protein